MSMNPTRTIHLPGEGLLPPSSQPMIPPDIRENEVVEVIPPQPPHFPTREEAYELAKDPSLPLFDRRYWNWKEAYTEHPTALRQTWVNDPGTAGMYGSGLGLDRVPDVVEFEVKGRKPKRGLPDLWEGYGVLMVSTRLLEVLLEVDADAIVHKPIVMKSEAGELIDDDQHMVDVVRQVWAVDFANSHMYYRGHQVFNNKIYPAIVSKFKCPKILDDLDPSFHLFRQAVDPEWASGRAYGCIASNFLKERIEKLKPKVRNVEFKPLYWGF